MFIKFVKARATTLSKTTYNLTYGCLIRNSNLKVDINKRVALFTSLSSDPFGSQSFSPKIEEKPQSTTRRTKEYGTTSSENDPFSTPQDVFLYNT
jgi:hypothetical protein